MVSGVVIISWYCFLYLHRENEVMTEYSNPDDMKCAVVDLHQDWNQHNQLCINTLNWQYLEWFSFISWYAEPSQEAAINNYYHYFTYSFTCCSYHHRCSSIVDVRELRFQVIFCLFYPRSFSCCISCLVLRLNSLYTLRVNPPGDWAAPATLVAAYSQVFS